MRLTDRYELLAERLAEKVAERLAELLDERDETPALLDAKGAARYLGVDRETVYALVRSGALPVIKLGDGPRPRLRFDRRALAEHLIQGDTKR